MAGYGIEAEKLFGMIRNLSIVVFVLIVFQTSGNEFVLSKGGFAPLEREQVKPELVLQTGHSKSVRAVVIGPNNLWVASGSFDNTVKIWDFKTGRELRALTGHTGAVKALGRSRDGRWLVSGGNDKTVKIWDVETGTEVKSVIIEEGTVESVAFSNDGRKIASGSSVGIITIWDVSSGQELFRFNEHTDSVTSLAFSPDDALLASGSSDTSVKTWDVVKGKKVKNLIGHKGKITALQFSENGEILASGSSDKIVRIWKNGREFSALKGHVAEILALNFTSDGKFMSVDSERTIRSWDITSRRELGLVSAQDNKISKGEPESAAFGSDGKFLAIGYGDRTVTISDAKTGKSNQLLENRTSGSYGVAFSSDRHWLASASLDNTLKLWDLQTGQGLPPLKGHTGYVTSVVFRADNEQIISASIDKTIRVWDAATSKSLYTLTGHTNSIGSIAVGKIGKLLVSGSADQTIGLWDLDKKEQIDSLKGHGGEVVFVALSPDETLIASASTDKTIKIWDSGTRKLLRTLEGHIAEVDAVAFSSDGQFIVSGGVDKTVRLWETGTGRLVRTISGHGAKINAVLFSPDGKQIISGSQDKTVRVWNVLDGQEQRVLGGHAGTVFSLAFTSDGKWLASASDDGSVIVWKKETGDRLSTLLSLKNSDDWLVVSPEGFFDGSPPAWDQLLWRFEKNTFNVKPVEVFFNEFYSPGLLADLLKGEKLPSGDISKKDRRQPNVDISLVDNNLSTVSISERRVKIKVSVSEAPPGENYQNGSGAQDIRLFRNGSLVKLWPGDVLANSGKTELETSVSMIAGENHLTAYGFNNENIKSSDAELIVNGAENLRRKGVFYIISIGVGKYANPKFNLNYVELDATEFGNELRLKQTELNRFERIEVISLFDQEATKKNIVGGVKKLAGIVTPGENLPPKIENLRRAEPEDTIAIFFSGHGTSQDGHFYVLPHDLGYTDPNQPLTENLLKTVLSNSISDIELEQAFREIDAGHLLLVVDACNSGQALESADDRRGPMNNKGLAQLAYDKGMYILTASQSIESAYVSEALKRSYLSYALVEEGLKTAIADSSPKDGKITIREWFDYATNRVPQLRKDVSDGLFTRDLEKGLEEEEEKQAVKKMPTQRPRVFYRRQIESRAFIISQAN